MAAKRFVPPPITPRATGAPAPLSFAQERLWFLEQLEPQSALYNICRPLRIQGTVELSALEKSLEEIVHRHETLRTAFRLIDGQPLQIVQSSGTLSIDMANLRALPENECDAEIQREIKAEAERAFDLHEGSLLRCRLLSLHDNEHILILTTHHTASDAWSMGILTRELWTLYQAFSSGKPSPLQPLPVQYSDYAVWQRNWLQGGLLEAQLAYWKEHLKNLPILSMPTDRPRKPRQSFNGARMAITLPEELTSAINETSHRHAVTPFMTLLAAFQVLLYRYTGQNDFAVGSPVANRRRPEVEGLIGFFVNTLVLRADLSGNPSFRHLLLRVKDACLAADANQDLPFEKLVQELQPERDLNRNPLFQVMFVLQNATSSFTGIPGLRLEPIEIPTTRSPFDLSLFLREREGKYIGYIEYSTDLFNHDRIERMAGHFQILLEAIVADPDQSIATLPILTEAERHKILVEWNDTAADFPKDKCIHQLFEEQVQRTPDSPALEFEDKQITYRELNRRANQLAHYLISLGIGPEKLVGICVERSIEMVVGLLGILKAGGAYVPLDPAYPKERLRFMVEDARLSALLTQEKWVKNEKWRIEDGKRQGSILHPRFQMVCLDRDWPLIAQQSDSNPNTPVGSENLAYVIYTSGSTGQPKGVQIQHRSAVNCIYSIEERVKLTAADSLLSVTTISFDIAALELYLPLVVGAKVVLASREDASDGKLLVDRLEKCGVTAMQATPSGWRLLLDAGWRSSDRFKILCGGETLSRSLADDLLAGGASLWNLYGPTETTIWSTIAKIQLDKAPILIGEPLKNTKIYVLDDHLQPVPIGVAGELYIAGDGVARGYLNRPKLTGEKFISHRFGAQPGSRLYRTGDLVRYRPDGQLEFLGRRDNQVKIRGHRVELDEVDAALRQHVKVQDCVTVARSSLEDQTRTTGTGPGDSVKSLVAYVVPAKDPITLSELRSFLTHKLPEYMIPSAVVTLQTLPLTPNGKVDREKLPPPDHHRRQISQEFIPPRSEIEELIAQIWKEVLRVEEVGVHNNFFELGGHSLLAAQIISRLQDAFHREIPLRVLFDTPTIAGLAGELENLIRQGHGPELPPIVPAPRDGPVPLSLNQEHLWRLDRMIPGTTSFNMPYVYRLSGDLQPVVLEKAVGEIIRRHEALRTAFAEADGHSVQIIKAPDTFQLPIVDLRRLAPGELEKTAASLILKERQQPFDLAAGPLVRIKLLRLTDKDYFLLVTTHHIISDDWSMHIFKRELAILYDAFLQGRASPLTAVPMQYADYAIWENKALKGRLFDAQLEYWRKQLAIVPCPGSKIGTEKAVKPPTFRTAIEPIEIEEPLFFQLRKLCQEHALTPFTVLLAALNIAIHLVTGERDIRIGIVTANRKSTDRERVMGNFTNILTLRTQVDPTVPLKQFMTRLRDDILTACLHQEVPFEHIHKNLQQEQTDKPTADFQVQVIYRNSAEQDIALSGITLAPFPIQRLGVFPEFLISDVNLLFHLRELSTQLTGSVTYKTGIVDQVDVQGFLDVFNAVVRSMIEATDRPLCSLSSQHTTPGFCNL